MIWYYLAFLILILEIILFISIIGIPVVLYLRDHNDWFSHPFNEAYCSIERGN